MIILPQNTALTPKQVDRLIELQAEELSLFRKQAENQERQIELSKYQLQQQDKNLKLRELREERLAKTESKAS